MRKSERNKQNRERNRVGMKTTEIQKNKEKRKTEREMRKESKG